MPRFEITSPDGKRFEITAPEGATQEQALSYVREQIIPSPQQTERNRSEQAVRDRFLYSPTVDMGGGERFAAGAGKAVVDSARGVGQLAGLVSDADVSQSRALDKPLMDTPGGFAGNLTGNVGMSLLPGGALKGASVASRALSAPQRVTEALTVTGSRMLAPTTFKGSAALGGTMGFAQPAERPTERVTNTLMGVGTLTAAQAIPRTLGRVAAPKTPTDVRSLVDEGVQLTPGQILSGASRRVEEGLTSLPVLGDAIKGAQRRGIESFDTVAINRSLAPIGQKLPAGMKGHEAVAHAQQALGDAYEALLPKLKGNLNNAPPANALPAQSGQAARPTLKQELDSIRQMGANLPPEQAGQLDRIITNEVEKRFTTQGLASGETLKNIESKLGGLAKDFSRSDNYDVRTLGDAVKETQAALRRMVEDVNPGYGKELKAINEGYANFKRVQKAAGAVGAKEGTFTPAQLHNAAKAGDKSKDKARFAVGEALMQDLSTAGKNVMAPTVPDSGTPFRIANIATMGGGAYLDPLLAGGMLGAAGAYSDPAQKVIQALLVQRPELLRQLGPKFSATAPYAASAALPITSVVNANQ